MKNFVYIFLVLVFFNISVSSLYYLGVINHYSLLLFNNYFDILITNIILVIIFIIYSLIYKKFMIKKFNYFKIMILGLLLGGIFCLCIPNLMIEEYLFISLFISFAITFVSYSIYFETIKKDVFK